MKAQLNLMFLFAGALLTAEGADLFVSRTGTWIKYGLSGTPYTDLQTAVNDAQAGDTVWVEDGFVCDTGRGNSISGYGYPRIELPNRAFTLRSASGYVDEENGFGATIRGEKDPESTFEDGHGPNAVRPLNVKNSGCTIFGFILEDGATGDHYNYGSGGAIFGGCVVSNYYAVNAVELHNCVVWNNDAPQGEFVKNQVPAEYSLSRTLTAGENGNKNEDPVFMDGYWLGAGSPAKNCAFEYGWMTDGDDVRSRDLAGRHRYQGPRPDMGCYETEISGTTISIY